MTQVVFTNGAWHGGWCWLPVQRELAVVGVASAAIELLGFGGLRGASPQARRARPFNTEAFATERSAVADLSFDQVVDALVDDLQAVAGGEPVVLVGHSLGGVVVTAAVERTPQLVSHLVLIAAMTPVAGMRASAYNTEPEMADSLLPTNIAADPAAVGALRCDFDGNPGRSTAQQTFYGDLDPSQAETALDLLTSDCAAAVDVAVTATADRFGAVPRTWVLTEQDRAVRPEMQQRLIRELDALGGAPTAVRRLHSSHSPFLSQPAALARIIASVMSGKVGRSDDR